MFSVGAVAEDKQDRISANQNTQKIMKAQKKRGKGTSRKASKHRYRKKMSKQLIDFYHIIGIADLTDKEMVECCRLTKELNNNRATVKWLAHQPIDRAYIAEKKKEQIYKLQSGIRLRQEE